MLSRIFIQNFALIDSLEIHLNRGLQVITGETGAGKSIILGALRLLMGERVDAKAIQNTEAKSIVEGEFRLQNNLIPFFEKNDLDFESSTIIRREILVNGKSRAFINDVPTTLDVLKSLSEQIIDIHSQFETSHLFSEKFQFEIIDGLGNNFENPIIMFFEAVFVATGILFVLSEIAGYGKSQKEKDKIEREIFEQFHKGMTRRTRYDLNKRIMNDQINNDIKDNIAKGINRSSRNK